MRIRSITLHGFKSFGNRTTLELSPRVSVIAGPNGSGKSNVVDGLRWATGGGRASEFRAGEKTELIFHGASGKRSVGYAEVEVEVELASGKVSVQRTLERDGTGRLRLNGRAARFMDIDDALSGTGLGKGSLAIIGQGEISSVLMADPSRLLSFVAEAAGVARLAGRREQAEARLARARDHMARLQDLSGELERQLGRLEAEAESASRQADLSREVLALQFTLAGMRRSSLESELRTLANQEVQLEATVTALAEDRQLLDSDLRTRRQLLSEQQESYRSATAAVEAWKGEVRLAEGNLQALRQRLQDSRRQIGLLEAELVQLREAREPEPPTGSGEELELQAAALRERLAGLRAEQPGLEDAAADARQELDRLRELIRQREEQLGRQQERMAAVSDQLQGTRDRLRTEAAGATESLPPERSPELEAQLGQSQALLDRSREQLNAAQEKHAHALAATRSLEVAEQRLQAAIAARSGFAEGPRVALTAGLNGTIGAVADLLELDDRHRQAIAAALGGRSEYIVVETAEQAQAVIRVVRDRNAFVTVLPLDLVRSRPLQSGSEMLKAAGVIGPAIEHISFEPRFEPLFRQLLGSTLIMETLDSAVALARRRSDRPRLVTLQGEILDPGGAMSGGKRHGNAGVLGQARELAALRTEAAAAREAAASSLAELGALQQAVRDQQTGLKGLQDELEAARELEASQRQQAAIREHLRQELEQREAQLQAELERLEAQELPGVIPETELRVAQEAARDAESRVLGHAAQLAAATAAEQEARSNLAVWRERHASFTSALERHRLDAGRATQLAARLDGLAQDASRLEHEVQAADAGLAELRKRPPAVLESVEAEFREARVQLNRAEQRLDGTAEELNNHQQQLERLRLTLARRETMLQSAAEEAGRFPPGLVPIEGAERGLRSRLHEASRELEELGPVNHRAAAELEQERLRSRQLSGDLLDAEKAADELLHSLDEVDQEVTSRSEAAILAVREAFLKHVVELFGPEAEAGIETLREDGRPTGLGIRLQPPGKRTTQLNLLSVGERTMGALAFLFALMDGSGNQGLPIAVLDEVDAPLDEANISRFTSFVQRLAERGTQFLLISHQKTTFTVADSMWGITSDKGVSSVFSISRTPWQAELTLEPGSA